MPKTNAAAYCRVSTDMDTQEGSYEYQVSYYRKQIESNPELNLVEVYGDQGASGCSIRHRPEFQRMIRDCEAGRIDVIFCKSISRFARNLPDCIRVIRQLRTIGVAVIFEKECLNTLAPNIEFLLNCLAAIAEEESVSIGQNVRWGIWKKNEAGHPFGKPPYGYTKDEAGNWVIVPNEAHRVKLAFDMANRGEPYYKIRQALADLEERENTGRIWVHPNLLYMLKNRAYTGDVLTNKTYNTPAHKQKKNRGERQQFYIEDHHEPIVPRAVYERVNEILGLGLLKQWRKLTTEEKSFLSAPLSTD